MPSLPPLPTPLQVQQALQSALEAFGRDLNRLFAVRPLADTASLAAVEPAPGDVIYGNLGNAKYWQNQGNTNTCVLMSTAMVIGQLTGKMPSQQQIVAEAANTPSVSDERSNVTTIGGTQHTRNGMVYQTDLDEYVYYSDSLQLLYNHKITASATYYTNDQSTRAFSDLEAALGRGDSVIVSINSIIRNDAVYRRGAYTGGTVPANHAVTVIAVNATKGMVYINDTALSRGQGNPLELSIDDFIKAWKPGKYTLITAHLATPDEQADGPAQFVLAA